MNRVLRKLQQPRRGGISIEPMMPNSPSPVGAASVQREFFDFEPKIQTERFGEMSYAELTNVLCRTHVNKVKRSNQTQ